MLKKTITVKSILLGLAIGSFFLSSGTTQAQTSTLSELKKHVANNRIQYAQYGNEIAVNGDFAFVGSENVKVGSESNAGAVHILKRDAQGNWAEYQRLESPTPKVFGSFGYSISSYGDRLVISEPFSNSNSGKVFIYKLNASGNWTLNQTLLPVGNITSYHYFGYKVALEGNTLVLGSPLANEYSDSGKRSKSKNRCFIYELNASGQFIYKQDIFPNSKGRNDHFGAALDFKDGKIIVGAYDKSTKAQLSGGAYVYSQDAAGDWILEGKLYSDDLAASDYFGTDVAISGDFAVVGAQWEDHDENGGNYKDRAGSAYIFKFENNKWTQIQKIVPENRYQSDYFGKFLDIKNDIIVVSATDHDYSDNGGYVGTAGAAFVYKLNDAGIFEQTERIAPTYNRFSYDRFGNAVTISDDQVFIGAQNHDYGIFSQASALLSSAGAIYVADIIGAGDDDDDTNLPIEVYVGPEDKIVPSDRGSHDDFGTSLAVSGDFAIVGAAREDHDVNGANKIENAGSAYILKRNQYGYWGETQKLTSSDRALRDFFGQSVSIDGDYAVVGGFNKVNKNDGAAYIYKKDLNDNWVEVQKLSLPNASTNSDFYGWSVAISGNFIVVGAPETTVNNGIALAKAGMIHVYENNGNGTFNLMGSYTSSDIAEKDKFGFSVAIDGDNIIVGAYHNNPVNDGSNINDGGAAYIFSKQGSSWIESEKLIASNAFHADYFGFDVDIDGDIAVVGAFGQDQAIDDGTNMERAGGAYIFKNNSGTWTEVQELSADDRETEDRFGSSVGVSGANIIVGAYGDDKSGSIHTVLNNKAGAAYAYHTSNFDNWSLIRKINSDMRQEFDHYGKCVAISGADILIGAPGEKEDRNQDNSKDNAGAVYFYEISATPFAKTAPNTSTVESISNSTINSLRAYPNPVSDVLNIEFDKIVENATVSILNLNGQTIKKDQVNSLKKSRINVGDLPSGIYILNIRTPENVKSIRFIKG